jgi:hypothetical protein
MHTGLHLKCYFRPILAKIVICLHTRGVGGGGGVMKCNENWSGAKNTTPCTRTDGKACQGLELRSAVGLQMRLKTSKRQVQW